VTWERAKGPTPCGSCGLTIDQGQPVLLVTSARLKRCAGCASTVFKVEPPSDWPVEAPVPQPPPSSQDFAVPKGWASKFRAAVDKRVLRLAERDR
jgi:hypothetical protein